MLEKKIKQLSPTQFENLVFDLMILSGLRNAVWRTPGADGGRDIEGEYWVTDLSEEVRPERWYIECKRYQQSIDWPTVSNKIPYAKNHDADYLFFVTTSSLSPRCKDEIAKREAKRKRLRIRYWDGTRLASYISRHAFLQIKYGLCDKKEFLGPELLPLLDTTSKAVQSAYSKSIFTGQPTAELEFSAALVDLILARADEIKVGNTQSIRRFNLSRDLYDWCRVEDGVDLTSCDSFGLRAFLSGIRFYSSKEEVSILKGTESDFEVDIGESRHLSLLNNVVSQIALYSNIEVVIAPTKVCINIRRGINES
jgi:hypothetical protein